MPNSNTPEQSENNDIDKNILAVKLERLEKRYTEFSHKTEKPLLRWQVDPGDEELVRVFIACEQAGGGVDDIMVDMTIPFDDEERYAEALVTEINRQYEEDKPAMEQEGLDTGWVCPEREEEESGIPYMLRVMADFHVYHVGVYGGVIHHLALVLRPERMSDPSDFVRWMERVLKNEPPPEIRFVVLDPLEAPRFVRLVEEEESRVYSSPLQLDYPGMLEELAKGEDNQQGPDAEFRVLFMKLSNQAEQQDIDGAEQTATQALAVAKAQGWYQMQVVVHMVLGACYLQIQELDEALTRYKTATETAREAKAAGDPAGPKMEIQALFAEASVVFAKENYLEAAEIYETAAPLAEQVEDTMLTMEGWRMAAYCYEVEEQYEPSTHYGKLALDAGETLPEDQRARSTLAYAGDGLLRVIEKAKKKHQAKGLPEAWEIEERMEQLLGEDWRDGLVTNTDGEMPS
jgi:tetratricopeptide (TPR) repeat protein